MNFPHLLTDTSGRKSVTMTAFCIGFLVVNFKLVASGMTIGGYHMADFSGADYGMALSALGAIYVLRRSTDPNNKNGGNNNG